VRFNPDEYIGVHERIEKFYAKHPLGRILTAVVEHDREMGFVLMRAEVYREPDDAQAAATGHAYETRSSGQAQQGSYVEVCESSAVGRALMLLGFEVKRQPAQQRRVQPQEARQEQAAAPSVANKKRHKLLARVAELRRQARELNVKGVSPTDLNAPLDRMDEAQLTAIGKRLSEACNRAADARAAAEERASR
jgi:hypothetical protein